MKCSKFIAVITVCLLVNACKDEEKPVVKQEIKIESAVDNLSYAIGFNQGKDFKDNGLADINVQLLALGIQDALDNKEQKVSDEKAIAASTELQTRHAKQLEQEQADNLKLSQNFLAENGKREGVITTESGLQYEILVKSENNGRKAQIDDLIKVHYHGTLIDGKVFDSSVDRGEPTEFPLAGVISGWQEGLQLMQEGEKFKFFIPPHLAYGESSPGSDIPANATLIFEVELLKVSDKKAKSINADEEKITNY